MTDAKMTPETLAEQQVATGRKLAAAQAEFRRLSLAAAEGDAEARELLDLQEQDLAALQAEQQRLAAAQAEAETRATEEARATEQRLAEQRAAQVRTLVDAQLSNVARLDAAVAEMRAALRAMRDGNAALGTALGSAAQQSIHDFNLKLPIMIDTALAIGGFQFKSMPFVARDAEGLPDLAACRLAPLYPAGWLLRVAGAQ